LQFIALYKEVEATCDELFWGDEVEYAVLETGGEGASRTVRIVLDGSDLMAELNKREKSMHNPSTNGCSWHQEYGSWMLEGTPLMPYSGFARDLVEVELNMRLRRARLLNILKPNQIAPTMTNFPLLGAGPPFDFTVPAAPVGGPASESSFVSDKCINPHPRFGTLTANIRARRGSKVNVRMPLMRDANTPEFKGWDEQEAAVETKVAEGAASPQENGSSGGGNSGGGDAAAASGILNDPLPFHLSSWPKEWPLIAGDCMAFGMGCCCLQVTFQSRDVAESRFMYDQLAGLAPIMLALTAATPIFKGRLMDSDVRWSIISQAVDDRTPTERGATTVAAAAEKVGAGGGAAGSAAAAADPAMAGGGIRRLAKSRYDSISCFLSEDTPHGYNDVTCEVDAETEALVLAQGMDKVLAKHVGHLFTRDPLVMFSGQIEEVPDDGTRTDHWESLQSTNWQTMRWKPPPPTDPAKPAAPHIGWRTEFRSMEVQLSDFENAAFTVFIVLLTRTLLVFDLDLLLPLSKTDENMSRAHARKPVTSQKFWFRKDVTPGACRGSPAEVAQCEKTMAAKQAAAEEAVRQGKDPKKAAAEAGGGNGSMPPGCPMAAAAAAEAAAAAVAKSKGGRPKRDPSPQPEEHMFEEMSMGEVLGGKGDHFPGLVPLVYAYLEHIQCDRETFKRLDVYLSFIMQRGTGEIGTDADFIRNFVVTHADYKGDSVVSPAIAHDLALVSEMRTRGVVPLLFLFHVFCCSGKLTIATTPTTFLHPHQACDSVGRGVHKPQELFGLARQHITPVVGAEAYGSALCAEKLGTYARSSLVRRLTQGREPWEKRMERESQEAELAFFHQDSK
jgi:glutamate--cysteine ligase catalytic subunit